MPLCVDDIQRLLKTDILLVNYIEHEKRMFSIIDRPEKFLYVNKMWTSLLGYEKKELYNTNLFRFIHPEDLPKTRKAFLANLEEPFENRYISKDGCYKTLVWSPHVYKQDGFYVCTCTLKTP